MIASKPEASRPQQAIPSDAVDAASRSEWSPPRLRRLAGIASGAALAMILAGCGGGGGGGGGDEPPPPPVAACVSQDAASDTGFALGVCGNPPSTVLMETGATVVPAATPRGYTLTLAFPAGQPGSLGGSYSFGTTNKTAFGVRDLIGAVRGEAFEDPPAPRGAYTAITGFHKYWDGVSVPEASSREFAHIDFGVWERAGTETPDTYFGVWHAKWNPGAVNEWPAQARVYEGPAVGVLGPHRAAGDTHADRQGVRTYGFSARVRIAVDASGRIIEGQSSVSDLVVSFPDPLEPQSRSQTEAVTVVTPMPIRQDAGGTSPAALAGNLVLTDGGPSAFEAQFFGTAAAPATEIAGRFRFKTAAGMFAIGAFGASVQAQPQ